MALINLSKFLSDRLHGIYLSYKIFKFVVFPYICVVEGPHVLDQFIQNSEGLMKIVIPIMSQNSGWYGQHINVHMKSNKYVPMKNVVE